MATRPKIKPELTPTDKAIEVAGWVGLALLWILTLASYSTLPDTIPVHFNGAGEVDNYGDKTSIFMLPVIGTIVFLLLSVLNRFPHIFNYPVTITASNAERQYTLATRLIRYLRFAVTLIFSLIIFQTFQVATGRSEGPGVWLLPQVLAVIFIPLVFYSIQSFRTKKS